MCSPATATNVCYALAFAPPVGNPDLLKNILKRAKQEKGLQVGWKQNCVIVATVLPFNMVDFVKVDCTIRSNTFFVQEGAHINMCCVHATHHFICCNLHDTYCILVFHVHSHFWFASGASLFSFFVFVTLQHGFVSSDFVGIWWGVLWGSCGTANCHWNMGFTRVTMLLTLLCAPRTVKGKLHYSSLKYCCSVATNSWFAWMLQLVWCAVESSGCGAHSSCSIPLHCGVTMSIVLTIMWEWVD